MSRKQKNAKKQDKQIELLQDLLITHLGNSGVPQHEIRNILSVDIHKVNRIVRHLPKKG